VDLKVAIQKHAEWKFKFRNAIFSNEQMDAAAIARDSNCEFGKWLHGEGRALYGHGASYAKCLSGHAAFHVEAGKIAAAINAKKKDEAEKMLGTGSAFSEASKKVSLAIVELGHEVGV
jgi:methyl-accepting chemotaxis protein